MIWTRYRVQLFLIRPSWPTAVCLPCNAWCVAWKVSVYCLCFEMFENPSCWDWIWCDLGHLPTNCPDEQLPPLVKLPPMTREFLGLVDSLCKVAILDTYFGNFLNKCFSPLPRMLSTTGSLRNRSFATGTTSCPTWTGESFVSMTKSSHDTLLLLIHPLLITSSLDRYIKKFWPKSELTLFGSSRYFHHLLFQLCISILNINGFLTIE